MENAVKDLEKEEADIIRAKINLTLQNLKYCKVKLSKDDRNALKESQSDTSIEILPEDGTGISRNVALLNIIKLTFN